MGRSLEPGLVPRGQLYLQGHHAPALGGHARAGPRLRNERTIGEPDPPMIMASDLDALFKATTATDLLESLTFLVSAGNTSKNQEPWNDQVQLLGLEERTPSRRIQVARVLDQHVWSVQGGQAPASQPDRHHCLPHPGQGHPPEHEPDLITFGNEQPRQLQLGSERYETVLVARLGHEIVAHSEIRHNYSPGTPGQGLPGTALFDLGRDLDRAKPWAVPK